TFFPDVNELDFYGNQRVVNSRVDMGVNEFSPTTSIPANYLSTTVPLIYPNPSTGLVFIQTEKDWDRLEVINLLGKKVVEKLISSRFEIIDLSDLPGVYLVRIISANKILSSARLMITADIK
ncbi:MAG: T9SS type A sorting domain-containing protein, partial [Bacteroidia bacterium]|nr:T9SS type A sorting domain-containing protein [Bacteroidia bacterium]